MGPTPLFECAVVVTVSVVVTGDVPFEVMDDGEKEQLAPAGNPALQLSETGLLNPLMGESVTV